MAIHDRHDIHDIPYRHDIHTSTHTLHTLQTDIHTYMVTYSTSYRHTYMHYSRSRHIAFPEVSIQPWRCILTYGSCYGKGMQRKTEEKKKQSCAHLLPGVTSTRAMLSHICSSSLACCQPEPLSRYARLLPLQDAYGNCKQRERLST